MMIFNTPYDPDDRLNGRECVILSEQPVRDGTIIEIQFLTGGRMQVWAEEVEEV